MTGKMAVSIMGNNYSNKGIYIISFFVDFHNFKIGMF